MSTTSSSPIADAAAECVRARQSYYSVFPSKYQDELNSISDLKTIRATYDSSLAKIRDELRLNPRESAEFFMYHQYSTALRLLGGSLAEIRDLKAQAATAPAVTKAPQEEIGHISDNNKGKDIKPLMTTRQDHLDILVGSTGKIESRTFNNLSSWGGFCLLRSRDESVNLFYASTPKAEIHHRIWTGTVWSPSWICLGGKSASMPVAISRDQSLIDLFFVGQDGVLYWKSWSDMRGLTKSGWTPSDKCHALGGGFLESAAPCITANGNRLDMFLVGAEPTEGELYRTWWDETWPLSTLRYQFLDKWSCKGRVAAVVRHEVDPQQLSS
ncbi:hypothetical protein AOQ84DRAFT_359767 [Glonium stellatum]|uniref:Uncharacterized protein n=1 Tax=Glonium stellatum TaxID=574774 RepID=A0A8E2FB81_9PEZI|nr:hypothetical protein AOQ84DRAFT_359767 [Glonium stellatum]